ncbi:MAG TPA: helicase-related protein [Syntrophorhabdus sp.]|nr:helicase-related protein [Syntrophorhabdus sp.]HOH26924.1 helicase-related protein [Syntrophorhabdus sp.]
MITRSQQFDLGLDRTRIKDPRDAARQAATVEELLKRLFNENREHRWELQVLADEVGMGKTFVGLGTAFSVLEAMRGGTNVDDLRGCYQKILIITPNNSALFTKWCREVGEFVKRCVKTEYRSQAQRWFSAVRVERIDDLVSELRRHGASQRIIVANMNIFGGGRLRNYDIKRRHLLGVLFQYWGARFRYDQRERLLKGAPGDWPSNPKEINDLTQAEEEKILFSSEKLFKGLQHLDSIDGRVETLLETCREISTRFVRNRDKLFSGVERQLVDIYRALMGFLVNKDLPLVIVDEAHNWKNGPTLGSNGYKGFIELIGKRSRRAILLTATPFQLRPAEMLEILKVGDHLKTCPAEAESGIRRNRMYHHREDVIRPVLDNAAAASRRFAQVWAKLPPTITQGMIDAAWNDKSLDETRDQLQIAAKRHGAIRADEIKSIIDPALSNVDPDLRQLMREALHLFVYNADLSHELGAFVIRHRRHTEHRMFRVGMEYQVPLDGAIKRPDRHMLHAAPGIDVKGDGELPHYLLMRCVSEMKQGKGRSSLGSALTGCYSTLIDSAEGRAIQNILADIPVGQVYLNLLMGMVDDKQDPQHPKVREVVNAAVNNWKAGEKTLIFCFRTNTAQRLHDIIDERIRKELNKRRDCCMGGPESLKTLRSRLTGRDRDLVVLGLDRVLWSMLWAGLFSQSTGRTITPDDLQLMDQDLPLLAEAGLRYGIDLLAERPDRVFLHRATEHVIARRIIQKFSPQGELGNILRNIGSEQWIQGPYGLSPASEQDEEDSEATQFDERGVHSTYEIVADVNPAENKRIASELREKRSRARQQGQAILDVYGKGPNLWLGSDPSKAWTNGNIGIGKTIDEVHKNLFGLMFTDSGLDWESRRLSMQAIRRAILRESVLLRLLPDKKDLDVSGWGDLMVTSFFASLPGQRESMADRIAVFLEDLLAASGSLRDTQSARYALYNATRLRGQQFVALVMGNTDAQSRERIFSGFNTPLLPEVLVCTSVGQEGIDLHRQCRNVVHFDLAWNPAVLEQRTGRADRIGSKTFRERALSSGSVETFLEIGVPYLAGTYDERMYEELRMRAQTFEVLTGGDLSADDAEGYDDQNNPEGKDIGLRFIPLPSSMMESLRVNLHIWTDPIHTR